MGGADADDSRHKHPTVRPLNTFRTCLLGGAVGDALGAPVEFLDRQSIERRFGSGGIRQYVQAY